MRIASLVPSATEMLFALGLGESVVAVTHECDHPPGVAKVPRLTRSVIGEGLAPAEVDAAVRDRTEAGRSLYELDEQRLGELDPDLIVTQTLCSVCAVSYDHVRAVADRLPGRPTVLSLDPETIGEVLGDVARLGQATGAVEAAAKLEAGLRARLDAVRAAVAGAPRPRVAALEWLEPPFAGGHWVPEMIEIAGGEDPIGSAGARSQTISWEEVAAARPDVAVVMPCGFYVAEAAAEARRCADALRPLGARIVAVDAAASFSRPGLRLVDGTELLAHFLHPDRLGPPQGVRFEPVELL